MNIALYSYAGFTGPLPSIASNFPIFPSRSHFGPDSGVTRVGSNHPTGVLSTYICYRFGWFACQANQIERLPEKVSGSLYLVDAAYTTASQVSA